ncbi:MAG: ImmA/IrrE family metallo-endopeptidase [Actinobacteria bacterium]|nr:ImmA/IrrE family metallo-endopeptidase [Actinomycetota bacterium]
MSAESEARDAAEAFRADHHLGLQPIGDLVAVIEETCGVDVCLLPQGDEAHGMTVRHGHTTIVGVVTTAHPMRQRSTLAHELAHVLFDDLTGGGPERRWAARSPEEVRADAFARHLLVPIGAVRERVVEREVDERLVSDLVQAFGASPKIVAIQLREAGVIDYDLYDDWSRLTAPSLATKFGWQAAYRAMRQQSESMRPPQGLLRRATAAYAEGVVSVALLARLNGTHDIDGTRRELDEAGIVPKAFDVVWPSRPEPTSASLTSDEVDTLLSDLDD